MDIMVGLLSKIGLDLMFILLQEIRMEGGTVSLILFKVITD